MGVFQALSDFVSSIFELIFSFFQTAYDLFATIIGSVFSLLNSILNVFVEFFKGIVDVLGGLGSFVLGNAAVLILIAAVFFGYTQYQKSQGRAVVIQGKKVN